MNWEFKGMKVGDYQVGYIKPPKSWSIGLAVAASSCFPPFFQPFKVPENSGSWRKGKAEIESPDIWKRAIKDLRLTDGGVYDNLGLEPVWKNHAHVLVSDAGGIFDFQVDKVKLLRRVLRYQSVQKCQIGAVRKRWLVDSFNRGVMAGTYWSTGSSHSSYKS